MYLENIVFDAADPRRLGRLWESVIGGETLSDEDAGYETRLAIEGGPVLDLCFQPVPLATQGPSRLHVDLAQAAGSGPIAALRLESRSPDDDAQFWAWLSGWRVDPDRPDALRHPSGRGPLLVCSRESAPKTSGKNRVHLDIRLESGDDPALVADEIVRRGGRELPPLAEGLPWRLFADPSGNEFCLLPARA